METKDQREQFSRFLFKYMAWKCSFPGNILFFDHNDFFFTLFDDALFMGHYFKISVENMDGIPIVLLPKTECDICARKILRQNRTVKLQGKSKSLSSMIETSRVLH